jgi:hypothetical protein
MLKKIVLLSSFISLNLMANCPNLTGTYQCLNFQGISYTQTITLENTKEGLVYNFQKKNNSLKFIVNGKQHLNLVDSGGGGTIKMLYRGICKNHTYINEFYFDNKITVVRGNSEFFLTKEGYAQQNTVIFPDDSTKKSTEECKRLDVKQKKLSK